MTGTALAVAIMTDETGWHTGRLKKAFRARGVDARCVDLAACRIDTSWSPFGLAIPGFARLGRAACGPRLLRAQVIATSKGISR